MAGNELAIHEDTDRILIVSDQITEVQRLYREVLKDGEDYGIPEGMNIKKPFLFQAGIEKAMRLHKLNEEYVVTYAERDIQQPFFYFEIKCILRNADGEKVAEGDAISHTEEQAYQPSGYSRKTHADLVKAGVNRCRKMGNIRALRSAIKGYGMLSHIFNIDEDTFDSGQQNPPIDPLTSTIESPAHVAWLSSATRRTPTDIATILKISKWGDWVGTLLEAYNAVLLNKGAIETEYEEVEEVEDSPESVFSNDENREVLRELVGGDITDDLMLSFLGILLWGEWRGTIEEARDAILQAANEGTVSQESPIQEAEILDAPAPTRLDRAPD